jgi:spore germination protein
MEQILQAEKENNWFYVSTAQSLINLRLHAREIDHLVPFWFGVTEQGTLVEQSQPEAIQIARESNLPILAIIHNFADPQMGELIHELLTNATLRQRLIDSIESMLVNRNFIGVNIDFEFIPPSDRAALNAFMEGLYRRLSPRFKVTISVPSKLSDDPEHPFSGAFDYRTLAIFSDQIFVLAYDEHFSVPGPVASIGFVRRVLNYAVTVIPRPKIKLGMAVYGYDWEVSGGCLEVLPIVKLLIRLDSTVLLWYMMSRLRNPLLLTLLMATGI